jgi:OHCU decarboxylase
MTIGELNALPDAEPLLLECCGSTEWARRMAQARPFASVDAALAAGAALWDALPPSDWLEAFAAHPRIGDRTAGSRAAHEQSGAMGAPADVRARLEQANRAYEARFGYIFIVRAAGRSAEEMLAIAEERLAHDPARELQVAAGEQRDIMRRRLLELLRPI